MAVNLKRNEHYFLPNLPYLDAITFQPMADDNARVTALRSGAVDFIDYVPFTQMDVIQKSSDLVFKSEPDGYTLLSGPPPPLVINRLLYPSLPYDPQWQPP